MKSKIESQRQYEDGEGHRSSMTGEEVQAMQEKEVAAQREAHSELQRYLMNSGCTPGARVEHPVNELEGITTLVKPEEYEEEGH